MSDHDFLQPDLEMVIVARERSIGPFQVRRVLPYRRKRAIGPFLLLDHMGPATLFASDEPDILPHPHINLSTLTYLFEGELVHRDSLGTHQRIAHGEINWMTAGKGIVHSERLPHDLKHGAIRMHGLQLWLGLPAHYEETAPSFQHYGRHQIPTLQLDAVRLNVLVGAAFGVTSPVRTLSPTLLLDAVMPAGSALQVPEGYRDRGVYVVSGQILCGSTPVAEGELGVLPQDANVLQAVTPTRIMILGGAPLDGPRVMWWNLVSSSSERVEEAKRQWRQFDNRPREGNRFQPIPGDDQDFIPLPPE